MKWSIVGLLFFGIVAAVCAAVLVAFLQAKSRPQDSGMMEIFVASSALPRGKILDPSCIVKKEIPKKEAPEGNVTNEVQVIGKVLAQAMLEGQAFTTDCFARQGSGYRVASVLPQGMRAMTLSLQDHAGLYGILYPGCYVDVLSSFKSSDNAGEREAMALTLLQGIQVLAVEEHTLVGDKDDMPAEGKKSSSSTRAKKLLVTVMVDLDQANALTLATQYGTVSLALRNPTDESPVKRNQALLSKLASGQAPDWLKKFVGVKSAEAASPGTSGFPGVPGAQPSSAAGYPDGQPVPASESGDDHLWKMTVIRGGVITTQTLSLGDEEKDGTITVGKETNCADTKDDDGDGLTDCKDPDCADIPPCKAQAP
jgi:pilus assembly protein CpaB